MRRPGDVNEDELWMQKDASYNTGLEARKKLVDELT